MNIQEEKMYDDKIAGQDVLLTASYPRLALSILNEQGYPPHFVFRDLGIDPEILEVPMTPIENHYRIIEYARGAVKGFSVLMAERCGIQTLGPLSPAILSARCAREAWLIAATYIPLLDTSCSIDIVESSTGMLLDIRHSMVSDANALDFAFASTHIASSIISAGLTTVDFEIAADYYNMGDFTDSPKWGQHMAKQDDGPRRVEIYISDTLADRPWPHSTEAEVRAALDALDEMMQAMNAKPSLKVKIEKALASTRVKDGRPLSTPQEIAGYFRMSLKDINRRLTKYDTTVKQIFLEYATRWAVVLIEDTDKSIEEINMLTYQVSDSSSFARTLKQRTGKTFTEIRRGGVKLYTA
jgi:AraC-like DNA-binding protein